MELSLYLVCVSTTSVEYLLSDDGMSLATVQQVELCLLIVVAAFSTCFVSHML